MTKISFRPITDPALMVCASGLQSEPVLTITSEGKIIVGKGFTPDEAGRAAIDGMQNHLTHIISKAVEDERERCCQIVYGQDGSDNVAERTVRAIREQ